MADMTPDTVAASQVLRALADVVTEFNAPHQAKLRGYLVGRADALDEQDTPAVSRPSQ